MIIRKIQHKTEMAVYPIKYNDDKIKYEFHLVTTWYFLFIPMFVSKKLLKSTLE